jgi:gamma-glutamyltranspeptidase / glutathione hydrolase
MDARERAERIEAERWWPVSARTVTGKGGLVAATVSPIAVQAGLQALRCGGNAADAAATVALTQISTQLGSVVSFAGILSTLYYEAGTGQVHALDAGYNTYEGETDPKTIPMSDLGEFNLGQAHINLGQTPSVIGANGRKTLVPGFMAGIQALHDRFGQLPSKALFQPAIWYAENGVTISPILAGYFRQRKDCLSQTPEGRAFLAGAGSSQPQVGDVFLQPQLVQTLRCVATHGARYMYEGAWADAFVATVRKAGGKVSSDDLANYQASWDDACAGEVFGHTVFVPPNLARYSVLTAFGQKTHLTAFSCGLLMIITQEPAQSLAALDATLSIEVTVPRK